MSIVTEKTCSKCGETKNSKEFSKHKKGKDGLYSRCRECARKSSKEWRANNKDKVKEKSKRQYWENVEERREYARNRKRNKVEKLGVEILGHFAELQKRYVARNKEKVKKYQAEFYRKSDKTTINEKGRETQKRIYHQDLEKSRQKVRLKAYRRRHALGKGWSLNEESQLIVDYHSMCVYCHKKLNQDEITLDHVVPISKDGKNEIQNIVPACSSCNSSKSNNSLILWFLKKITTP